MVRAPKNPLVENGRNRSTSDNLLSKAVSQETPTINRAPVMKQTAWHTGC